MFPFRSRKKNQGRSPSLQGRAHRPGRSPFRPVLEALEDRTLLSTFQWTGLGASNLWSDANNWKNLSVAGQPPGVPDSGDALTFVAGQPRPTSVDDLAGRNFASLDISGSGYDLQSAAGVQLQVGSGDITASNTSGNNTISAAVNLAAAQQISVTNPNVLLTFSGLLTGAGGGVLKSGPGRMVITGNNDFGGLTTISAGEVQVNAPHALGQATAAGETRVSSGATLILGPGASGGAEQLRLNGPGFSGQGALLTGLVTSWDGPVILATDANVHVSAAGALTLNGAISGAGDLLKDGTGKLILAGTSANTYTGDTLINAGVVNVRKASALGTGGATTATSVALGAGLEIEGALTIGAESLSLAGLGTAGGGTLRIVSGDSIWSGPMSLSGTVTIAVDNAGDDLTVDGAIGGTGGFIKSGAGRLILNGADTYLGPTTVSEGVVRAANNSALGGTASGLPEVGTTVLAGAALELRTFSANGSAGGAQSNITVDEPLTLYDTGIANTGALRNLFGFNTWAGDITFGSSSSIGADQDEVKVTGSVNTGGTETLTKVGGGRLTLARDNPNLLGEVLVNQGVLEVDSPLALGSTASPTTVLGSLQVGSTTISEPLDLSGNLAVAGGPSTCAGTIILLGDSTISGGSPAAPMTVTGTITGTGNLRYLDEVILAGSTANGYFGNTNVSNANSALHLRKPTNVTAIPVGTVEIEGSSTVIDDGTAGTGSGQIASGADVILDHGGDLLLNGRSNTVHNLTLSGSSVADSGTGTLTVSGDITGNNGGSVRGNLSLANVNHTINTVGSPGGAPDLIIDAAIHGGGGFVKAGNGDLRLSGNNDYGGATQINSGVVEVRSSTALGQATTAGSTTVADGAALVVFGVFKALNSAEPLSLTGSGIANFNGAGPSGALLMVDVPASSNTADLSGQVTLARGTTVRVDASETLRLDGKVTGPGALTKVGGGTLILGGSVANDYLGNTTVAAGTLRLDKAATNGAIAAGKLTVGDNVNAAQVVLNRDDQIADGVNVVVLTGSTLDLNNHPDTIRALDLTGASARSGTGTLTVSADVTSHASSAQSNIAGHLSLGTAQRRFHVENGAAANDLAVSAAIGAGAFGVGLTKDGTGTLLLSGSTDNIYFGNTQVNEGILRLGKGPGILAVPLELIVGDGAHPAAALWLSDNQVNPGGSVIVNKFGLVNLNSHAESFSALQVNDASVSVGAGTLTLGSIEMTDGSIASTGAGKVILNGNLVSHAGATSAVISGQLDLGTGSSRTFTVEDGAADDDLLLSAALIGGNMFGLTEKLGAGRLVLSGNNTFGGNLRVSAGAVSVRSNTALSNATGLSEAYVEPGAFLELQNNVSLFPLFLALNGGTLRNVSGNNSWGSIVSLVPSTVQVDGTSTLTVSDLSPIVQVTKEGPGTLVVRDTFNNNTSPLVVNAGTLLMNTPTSPLVVTDVTVQGGLLGGTGLVRDLVANGGTVDPGANGPGTLGVAGDVTLNSGATFEVDLDGGIPGTDDDQLNVTGIVFINQAFLVIDPGAPPLDVPLAVIHARSGLIIGQFVDPATNAVLNTGDIITTSTGQQFEIAYGANDVFLTPRNTAAAFSNRSVTSSVTEGAVATLRGTIVEPDPLDTFTLVVDWGDGSPVQTFTSPAGSNGRLVQVGHVYRDNGAYVVHASWHDPQGQGNAADLLVTVNNVAPTVAAGGDERLSPGGVLNRRGSFSDPGSDTWTATVDYGDGSGPHALALDGGHQFRLHHKYRKPGTYVVTVTVRDDDGGVSTDTFVVTVPGHGKRKGSPAHLLFP
jgi:fibronectin-binding autotransporter adhesin